MLINHLFVCCQRLLNARELKFKFLVPLHSSAEEVLQIADQMVQTARISCMNEVQRTVFDLLMPFLSEFIILEWWIDPVSLTVRKNSILLEMMILVLSVLEMR